MNTSSGPGEGSHRHILGRGLGTFSITAGGVMKARTGHLTWTGPFNACDRPNEARRSGNAGAPRARYGRIRRRDRDTGVPVGRPMLKAICWNAASSVSDVLSRSRFAERLHPRDLSRTIFLEIRCRLAQRTGSMMTRVCFLHRGRSNGSRPSAVIPTITHHASRNAAMCAAADPGVPTMATKMATPTAKPI